MAKKKLKITVSPGTGIQTYTILIDGTTLNTMDNKGEIKLDSPARHILTWVMFGDSGSSFTIEGEVDGEQIFKKVSTVPSGESNGAGAYRFDI